MVILFSSSSCTSCRKAKEWLIEFDVPFIERDIYKKPLTLKELHLILNVTRNGTEDILSIRSKAFQSINFDLQTASISDLALFIAKNPRVVKRPILIEKNKILVGFNSEEIRKFLPREIRKADFLAAKKMSDSIFSQRYGQTLSIPSKAKKKKAG